MVLTEKHSHSVDSEDDFRSGYRNVSHQQQFFSELPSPGRSHSANYWYSWVQTIYYDTFYSNYKSSQDELLAQFSNFSFFGIKFRTFL